MLSTTLKKSLKANMVLLTYFAALIALYLFANELFAQATCPEESAVGSGAERSVGCAAQLVRKSMGDVAALITAAAYVAGIGFAMMGMLKLKAHKDNPTQVPLSQPITLLIISAGLVFLPSLINTAGQTIWGKAKDAAGTTGNKSDSGTHKDGGFVNPKKAG